MFLGRYQLGQDLVIPISTEDGNRVVFAPDSAPTLDVFLNGSKVVSNVSIPSAESRVLIGFFRYNLFLDSRFSTGHVTYVARYAIGGVWYSAIGYAFIFGGGDPAGSVIGMYQFEKPNARYIVHSTDGGQIFKGKNPRVP